MSSFLARNFLRSAIRRAASRSLRVLGRAGRASISKGRTRALRRAAQRAAQRTTKISRVRKPYRISKRKFQPTRRKIGKYRTSTPLRRPPETSPPLSRISTIDGSRSVSTLPELDASSSFVNPDLYEKVTPSRSLLSRTRDLVTKKNLKRAALVGSVAGGAAATGGLVSLAGKKDSPTTAPAPAPGAVVVPVGGGRRKK